MEEDIKNILASGQVARLIPTVPDSRKEEKAVSSLLACLIMVPDFADEILGDLGAPTGKRAKIECYTEVTFKSTTKTSKLRPDGLIVVRSGNKKWMALVEAKVKNAELSKPQLEDYLDLAKQNGINALITISNQFATSPSHHPIKIQKNKLRSVELYHFSWLSIVSTAFLITDNEDVEDTEQAYLLSELVRYLNHESSGVQSLSQMHSDWGKACEQVQQGAVLAKNSELVANVVTSWQQLSKHLALNLSMAIGEPVSISLPRAREKDAGLNFSEDCGFLEKSNALVTNFLIPAAASRIEFSADFLRKSINISMRLEAPKDKSRATASINWLTRQLKNAKPADAAIRAYWPKRIPMTTASYSEVLDNPEILLPPNVKEIPTALEVSRVLDMSKRFKGKRTFVEDATRYFPLFYKDIGQHLSKWVAKAPRIKEAKKSESSSVPNILKNSDELEISVEDKEESNAGVPTSNPFGVFGKFLS
ncbi:MAG: hypothetical protein RL839_05370 [Gammaproteobacteria bacterium]